MNTVTNEDGVKHVSIPDLIKLFKTYISQMNPIDEASAINVLAQLIERGIIKDHGVFCSEEIVPCKPFFKELKKRNIKIDKKIR